MQQKEKNNKLLCLDAGCGDGVHAFILKEKKLPLNLVAFDLSHAALVNARNRMMKNWELVQGDLCHLPFFNEVFDCAFSFGCIAYTKDPKLAFSELCRVVKSGGLIGIWILPARKGVLGFMFSMIRALCKKAGPFFTNRIADAIVPFLVFLPVISKVNIFNTSWKGCREIVLVNIAPKKLYFPDLAELKQWFDESNVKIIIDDPSMPGALWGKKL